MCSGLDNLNVRATVPVHYAYAARYSYSDVVLQNDNLLRLSAYSDSFQTPGPCAVSTFPAGRQDVFSDRFGNTVHRVQVATPHQQLTIAAAGGASLHLPPCDIADAPLGATPHPEQALEFLAPTRLADPETVSQYASLAADGSTTLLGVVGNVSRWIHENVRYERGHTSVNTPAADVLETMSGVCQDMTHLGLAMLRALGIPCRYVSGLLTGQPGETHAWLEFLHPEQGWLPADPTRGLMVDIGVDYLKFGVGRDYSEVPPVSGSFISNGTGQLDTAIAEVFFDRRTISIDDALQLLKT